MTRREIKDLLTIAIMNRDSELITYWSNELKNLNEKDKGNSKNWLDIIRGGTK